MIFRYAFSLQSSSSFPSSFSASSSTRPPSSLSSSSGSSSSLLLSSTRHRAWTESLHVQAQAKLKHPLLAPSPSSQSFMTENEGKSTGAERQTRSGEYLAVKGEDEEENQLEEEEDGVDISSFFD
eukprot:gb/GEZN01011293.1/.p1 GENE.gb/GEZN01011293.1/~~gb/GEZN01011293.1/.p1  ORF type:complete len:125 (-),score=46.46 gb/GEZN01011293.1/:363-737(-)